MSGPGVAGLTLNRDGSVVLRFERADGSEAAVRCVTADHAHAILHQRQVPRACVDLEAPAP